MRNLLVGSTPAVVLSMRAIQRIVLIALFSSACGSTTSPTAPPPVVVPPPPANIVISGTLVSTTSGSALSAILNTGNAQTPISGSFSSTFAPGLGTIPFAIEGPSVFGRTLWVDASRSHNITLDAIALDGRFDPGVYRMLVRNATEGGSEPLRRWTANPNVYLKTVDEAGAAIPAAQLDSTEATIREAVPQWTSGRLTVAILERGTGTREGNFGWLTVVWQAEADPTACGRANVGLSGGVVDLYYKTGQGCSCGALPLRPRTVRHEIGHAMGFWHTDSTADLMSAAGVAGCDQPLSARELFHSKIAYTRPVGNVEPDTDPRGTVNLAPSRMVR